MKYLFFGLITMAVSSFAAEVSTSDGIHITSDATIADMKNGIITYEGSVTIVREGVTLKANKIVEHRGNRVRIRVVATGNPVVYLNASPEPGGVARGTAERLEYSIESAEIRLENFMLIDTEGNSTGGKTGVYHLDDS